MYINDINIIAYVIVALLGAVAGQICDLLNFILPKHKKILSIENTKKYLKSTKPKYLLMVIHIIIYLGILYRYGINDVNTIEYMILTPMIISAFYIDYKMQIIPNRLTLTMLEVGIAFSFFRGINNLNIAVEMWLGMILGAGIFLLLTYLGNLIFKKETMGFGDVKLMASLGLFFGWRNVIAITVLSFFIATVFILCLVIKNKIQKKQTEEFIPFGPFIVLASFIVMFVPLNIWIKLIFFVFTLGKYKF